jgi:peptidoglycan hydrolase-like protein with peptidoglycan-binding domain
MLLPLVDYPDELKSVVVRPPPGLVLRLTSPPMSGSLVKALQRKLKASGIDPGAIDGVFGPHTEAAVRAFQLRSGLVADGEAGKVTLEKVGVKA